MMQKISQQHMDGPSGGGMFIMLRILWVFLIALGLGEFEISQLFMKLFHQFQMSRFGLILDQLEGFLDLLLNT